MRQNFYKDLGDKATGKCEVSMETPKGEYKIRAFQEEDLERVIYINSVCLPEHYSTYFYKDLYRRFPDTFLVAEVNGEVVGYIMCRIEIGISSFKILRLARKGHVVSIAVLPEYRNMGIGKNLLINALDNMKKYNVKECYLEVRVSNDPAIQLYRELGFQILKVSRGYYADGEDAYVMCKTITH